MRHFFCLLFTVMLATPALQAADAERPNIVWIVVEDMSPHFGCYGETSIRTPNVDRLAAEGVRFTNAVMTAPVCSAARSALITGMYQTSIGAHQHRSGRGELKIYLPEHVCLVPEFFRNAGYVAINLNFNEFVKSDEAVLRDANIGVAKTDYNFEWDQGAYDRTHWTRREAGRPFFVQVQLNGGKLRGHGDGDRWPARAKNVLGDLTPREAVNPPPDLPDDPVIVEDWRQYLDAVRYTDWEVGRIVERLKEAGELERTYVFFITDHGISHVRHKQFCYDGGVHIPLIVRGPGLPSGTVRTDPVEHIDLAAASLALAGIAVPARMQARDIFAADYRPRRYVFSARDRCDETVDRIRSVRSERYKYIRNFHPDRPYLQPNAYKDAKPIVQAMRRLHKAGKLNRAQSLVMAEKRPAEELYDLKNDPHELHNLADEPAHRETLQDMREALDQWIAETDDRGRDLEGEMYDSDMALYLSQMQNRPDHAAVIRANIDWMRRQAAAEKEQ